LEVELLGDGMQWGIILVYAVAVPFGFAGEVLLEYLFVGLEEGVDEVR
jgi:hypothetical protein